MGSREKTLECFFDKMFSEMNIECFRWNTLLNLGRIMLTGVWDEKGFRCQGNSFFIDGHHTVSGKVGENWKRPPDIVTTMPLVFAFRMTVGHPSFSKRPPFTACRLANRVLACAFSHWRSGNWCKTIALIRWKAVLVLAGHRAKTQRYLRVHSSRLRISAVNLFQFTQTTETTFAFSGSQFTTFFSK